MLSNGKHYNKLLQADYSEHGRFAFRCTEICRCSSEDRLNVEFFWIHKHEAEYNLTKGRERDVADLMNAASAYRQSARDVYIDPSEAFNVLPRMCHWEDTRGRRYK